MTTRFRQRLIVTLLALFVGMGTVVSAVEASDMVLKMAISDDAGLSGAKGCDLCGGDEGNASPAYCPAACVPIAHGLLSGTAAIAMVVAGSPAIAPGIPPRGSTGIPDPSPPKHPIPA